MLTEQARDYKVVSGISARIMTAGVSGDTVDAIGFNSVMAVVNIGTSGTTLDNSNFLGVRLQESDDNSTWESVTDVTLLGGIEPATSTSVVVLNDSTDDEQSYKLAYTGNKRYLRCTTVHGGTISIPISVTFLLGDGLKPQE